MRLTAPRDRAQGAAGDQREEAGAVGEGGEPAEPRESSGGAGIAGRVREGVGVRPRQIVVGFIVLFRGKVGPTYLSASTNNIPTSSTFA